MALQNVEANITLDLYNHDTTPATVKAIQLDSQTRYVAAMLQNVGVQYDVDSGATIQLIVVRPDNVGVQITGETFEYGEEGAQFLGPYAELTQVALAVSGKMRGQFKITSGNQILRTEIFAINNGVALDASTDEWADEYDGYNLEEMATSIETNTADIATLEADVSQIKEDLQEYSQLSEDISYEYTAISPKWESGYIKSSNGEVAGSSSETYHHTEKIRLNAGQCIKLLSAKGSGSVSILAVYSTDGTYSGSILDGNTNQTERSFSYQNRSGDPVDVIISSNASLTTTIFITSPTIINDADFHNAIVTGNPIYALVACYFDSDGVYHPITTLSGNNVTTPIFLKRGKRIIVKTTSTTSVAQLMISDRYGAVQKVIAMNTGASLTTSYVAMEDVYVVIGGNISNEVFSVLIVNDAITEGEKYSFNLCMPTVTFVFDDGTAGDANAVNVFKKHGKRCSFALISSIVSNERYLDYLRYQDDGFEILSHSTDGRTMNGYSSADITVEADAIACMVNSKRTLMDYGFDIHGWVTPSGRLNPAWVKDVKLYYDYGFVLANMTSYSDAETQTPYFPRNTSAFSVFRVSLQNTTLEMCRAAVDLAISNRAMVVFYGHSVQETSSDNLTIGFLDDLLTYIDTLRNDVQVLPCNSAMKYFFKVTHEDFIS